MRRIQHTDYRSHTVRGRRSRIADGGIVGIEELPKRVDIVRHVKALNGEFLTLKARPVGRRAGRARDADAVIVAEFDGPEETLSEGLAG